jgi:hypothetical protein
MPVPAQQDIARGVYAALLSASYHGVPGAAMLVRDEWISIPPLRDSASPVWLDGFDGMPAELLQSLRRSSISRNVTFDRALFPIGTRFISTRLIEAVFSRPGAEGWPEFRRQHMAAGYVSYSPVLATSDGMDAMVYAEAGCGGLCGEGVYHWLHRPSLGAAWSIMKSITSWIA